MLERGSTLHKWETVSFPVAINYIQLQNAGSFHIQIPLSDDFQAESSDKTWSWEIILLWRQQTRSLYLRSLGNWTWRWCRFDHIPTYGYSARQVDAVWPGEVIKMVSHRGKLSGWGNVTDFAGTLIDNGLHAPSPHSRIQSWSTIYFKPYPGFVCILLERSSTDTGFRYWGCHQPFWRFKIPTSKILVCSVNLK